MCDTYTGTTTINQGTLVVDSVVVASGASGLGNATRTVLGMPAPDEY
ncbi:hypothetical protein [Hyphomicrobium sp.]